MYNIDTKIIKAKIYEKGYNIKEISSVIGIHEQTLSNWLNYRNIDNINKFINLLYLLELNPKDIKKIED